MFIYYFILFTKQFTLEENHSNRFMLIKVNKYKHFVYK